MLQFDELNRIDTLETNCPVCDHTGAYRIGDLTFALPESYPISKLNTVVSCSFCGFIRNITSSTTIDFDNYYKNSSYSSSYSEVQLNANDQKYVVDTINLISKYTPKKASVIDLGIGGSPLLLHLKNHSDYSCYAVDLSQTIVDVLNKSGIESKVGSLINNPYSNMVPDFIILSHVVEHLLDLNMNLDVIRSNMGVNTKLYVEVPNSSVLDSISNNRPISQLFYTHLSHFDATHLKNLFISKQFEILEQGEVTRYEKGIKTPSIWMILKKSVNPPKPISPDFSLTKQFYKWFISHNFDIDGELQKLANSQKGIYIWGIGLHSHMMLEMSPLKDCNTIALVDKDTTVIGMKIGKHRVQSSELLANASENETVVITTSIHKEKMKQILIDNYKFNGEIIIL